jgi:predicted glycoside hydrolase/deacetylase ChbG (UPF0249 family)
LIPRIFRGAAVRLATEEHVVLRAMDGPGAGGARRPNLKELGLAIATRLSVGRRFRHLVAARGAGIPLRDHPTLDALRATLNGARDGDTIELVVHPGFSDDELRTSGDAYRDGRDDERALLVSEETRSFIRLSGFRSADFRGLGALRKQSGGAPQPLSGARPSAPTSS